MVPDRKSRSRWSSAAGCRRHLLALSLAVALGTGTAAAQVREDWYLAAHNHQETGLGVMIVTLDDGSRWIRILDLKLLDLPVPTATPRVHAGEDIVPLSSLGLAYEIDTAGERLHLLDSHAAPGSPGGELILDIVVNGQALPEAQVARRTPEGVLLSPETLSLARLLPPPGSPEGEWVPVQALAGNRYVLDEARMRLSLTADPARFERTDLHARARGQEAATPASAPLAAIFGYDAIASRGPDGSSTASLLLDSTLSRGRVSCRDRHLWRSSERTTRLDSNCIADWPQRRLSLTLGDAISRDSTLSAPVRYGGIRIGSDFSLQPELRTQPLLGVEGSARLPSLLEVWIEQELALRTEIPPGQFRVDEIPARTGRGFVTAVITDALGRQVLVNDPFYSDPRLLRTGLTDWALEFGRLREGFLTREDHYGDRFGLFTWRRGVWSFWTLGVRAEWQESHRLLGISNHFRLGDLGVVELSAARSEAGAGGGDARAAGYTYQGRRWNAGVRYASYDPGYRDLAYPAGQAPARDVQASVGLRVGRVSLSAGAMLREDRTAGEQRFLRAGLSMPIGRGSLGLSALQPLDDGGEPLVTAIFTLPLAERRSAAGWVNLDDGEFNPGLLLQKSLPAGPGRGYRLLAEDTPAGLRGSAEGMLRGESGRLDALLSRTPEGTGARMEASGSVVMVGKDIFLAPDDSGSFALVALPQAGATILREHQEAATTRGDGKALVPGLRPFDRNRLSVAPTTLDPSTQIQATDLVLVPGRRQVVVADFGASEVTPLTLQVSGTDGAPLPAGAQARIGDGAPVPVGYEGLLYLELEGAPRAVEISWRSSRCTIPAEALPIDPEPGRTYEATCQ